MAYYIVANIRIDNEEGYQRYQDGFLDVFAKFEGEILVVNDSPVPIEGDWSFTRLVVLRFPSQEAAERWYRSPEYQEILAHRLANSEGTIVGSPDFAEMMAELALTPQTDND